MIIFHRKMLAEQRGKLSTACSLLGNFLDKSLDKCFWYTTLVNLKAHFEFVLPLFFILYVVKYADVLYFVEYAD